MFLRHKISYLAIGAIATVFLAGVLFYNYEKNDTPVAKAALTDNIRGFAWSENIGWISFNSMGCDIDDNGFIDTDAMVLGCGGDNSTDQVFDYGVNADIDPISPAYGQLSGYAWSPNVGWITFDKAVAGIPPGAPYNGAETYIAKLDGANN